MVGLYTTAQVADLTGRKQATISTIAKRHGLGTKVGRDWLFTAKEVDAIRAKNPKGGRPPNRKPDRQ